MDGQRRAILTAILVLLAGGCGGNSSIPTAQRIGGGLLVAPSHPTGKVVVYIHGSGEAAQTITTDPAHRRVARALLDTGYAIAFSEAAGDAWGNPRSVSDYERLIHNLHGRGYRRVYLLAESMGGLAGLELLARVPIAGWAGLYPACNLRALYARPPITFLARRNELASRIRLAYGPLLASALRSESPVRLPALGGLPMVFFASPGDRVVPKAQNTDVCAAAARAAGAHVTVISTRGDHIDPSNFKPDRVLATFRAPGAP